MKNKASVHGSFRDPDGFIFLKNNKVYRQINISYRDNYDQLMKSGLYEELVGNGLLIPHEEVKIKSPLPDITYRIIKPCQIPFVSYPYEWCFSQMKHAALATLKILKQSINHGMILKDSSAYNIQFHKGKPLLIDTLSFVKYREGQPWIAYCQFCRHFLAPLILASYMDSGILQLLRAHIDGIPLDLAGSILPFRTRLKFSSLMHIHLHAVSQKYFSGRDIKPGKKLNAVTRLGIMGLIDSLETAVSRLKNRTKKSAWSRYCEEANYSAVSLEHKKIIVSDFIDLVAPSMLWDIGANVGNFSRLAAEKGIYTIAIDSDHEVVEKNYLGCVETGADNILPLVLDITNPSPGIGWENREMMSLIERGPADTVLALALIHHLAITGNLPFDRIVSFFKSICTFLIIEFVPKSDPMVQRLLLSREDIFSDYTKEKFEIVFSRYFFIKKSITINDSGRILYLMRRKK